MKNVRVDEEAQRRAAEEERGANSKLVPTPEGEGRREIDEETQHTHAENEVDGTTPASTRIGWSPLLNFLFAPLGFIAAITVLLLWWLFIVR